MANRARNPGEGFKDYRLSLAIEYLNDKANRRGRYIHISQHVGAGFNIGKPSTYNNGNNAAKRARRNAF